MGYLYVQDGKMLVTNGGMRQCCCVPPVTCHFFYFRFYYSLSYIPATSNPRGEHRVQMTFGGHNLVSASPTWNGGWGTDSASGTGASGCEWYVSTAKAMGYGSGIMPQDGSGTFEFLENRTFDAGQPNQTVTLTLEVMDSGGDADPNRIYGLSVAGRTYRPASQFAWHSFQIATWSRAPNGTASWNESFRVVR